MPEYLQCPYTKPEVGFGRITHRRNNHPTISADQIYYFISGIEELLNYPRRRDTVLFHAFLRPGKMHSQKQKDGGQALHKFHQRYNKEIEEDLFIKMDLYLGLKKNLTEINNDTLQRDRKHRSRKGKRVCRMDEANSYTRSHGNGIVYGEQVL